MNDTAVSVLCVDDQPEATSLLAQQLGKHFNCVTANKADEALKSMSEQGPFHVIVCDYLMPGMNGVELLETVRERWPDTARVMLTAMDTLETAIDALHAGHVYRFVRKPWHAQDLIKTIKEAAAYNHLISSERYLRKQLVGTNAELDEKVQDLDEANQLLEYWVEHSPAVLYSLSVDRGATRVNYVSKNFRRLTGFERTQAVIEADFWTQLIDTEEQDSYHAAVRALLDGEQIRAVIDYHIRHKSGSSVTVVDSLRAIQDSEGKTIEIVGAWLDVTARA